LFRIRKLLSEFHRLTAINFPTIAFLGGEGIDDGGRQECPNRGALSTHGFDARTMEQKRHGFGINVAIMPGGNCPTRLGWGSHE
jgi:hypothetical protein